MGKTKKCLDDDSCTCMPDNHNTNLHLFSDWMYIKCACVHLNDAISINISPCSNYFATGASDGSCKIFRADRFIPMNHIKHAHKIAVTSLSFSPDSQRLLSVSVDYSIKCFEVKK